MRECEFRKEAGMKKLLVKDGPSNKQKLAYQKSFVVASSDSYLSRFYQINFVGLASQSAGCYSQSRHLGEAGQISVHSKISFDDPGRHALALFLHAVVLSPNCVNFCFQSHHFHERLRSV